MCKQHHVLPASTQALEAALRQLVPAATVNIDEVEDTVSKFYEYILKPLTVSVRDRDIFVYIFVTDPAYVVGDPQVATTGRL
eukprot:2362835-Amphidinium_carterae.1